MRSHSSTAHFIFGNLCTQKIIDIDGQRTTSDAGPHTPGEISLGRPTRQRRKSGEKAIVNVPAARVSLKGSNKPHPTTLSDFHTLISNGKTNRIYWILNPTSTHLI